VRIEGLGNQLRGSYVVRFNQFWDPLVHLTPSLGPLGASQAKKEAKNAKKEAKRARKDDAKSAAQQEQPCHEEAGPGEMER
jgi:hypothetical protein